MNQKDYYKILGVSENAEPDEIKKAYRTLAFRYHPDKTTGNEEMMKELNEAYAVLSNPVKRKEYNTLRQMYGSYARDQFRQTHTDQDIFRDSDIGQIFEEFSRVFGFSRPEDIFSANHFYGQTYRTFEFRGHGHSGRGLFFYVPLRTVYKQKLKKYPDQTNEKIADNKPIFSKFMAIALSLAHKIIARKLGLELPQRGGDLYDVIRLTREEVHNGGKVPYLYEKIGNSRNLLIAIPPGIKDGQKIKLRDLGEKGKNGGETGDLYLKVKIGTPFPEKINSFREVKQSLSNLRLIVRIAYILLILGCLLFLPAGTLDWWRAWVLISVVAISIISTVGTMFGALPGRRELLNESFRSPIQKGQPLADKIILPLLVSTFLGLIVFIPIDVFRFHAMVKPGIAISFLGLAFFSIGWGIISLALKENPFAVSVVTPQKERYHRLIDTGIYGIVRHPICAGGILLMLGMPLWLESYAATLLAIMPIGMMILRILVEERLLTRELTGYESYMKSVQYRIIPYIW
jgi:curved DNA-binding protein CbpA/protein-S-isoprenylcysteine O-methyltransferase Ste14